jgi:glycosyltransferase involved in cell wall biosynthesis
MAKISVIVPVYKVEPYLHRCVDSILAQTFTDFELILVDDGSPDNCGSICDEYAEKDCRVHVIHQENGGLSAARNAGIDWVFANSDSEWLSFVDSDDWVSTLFLENLYSAIKQTNLLISACPYQRVEAYSLYHCDISSATSVNWDDFYLNDPVNAIIAWNKLYNKELFNNLRYPVNRIHEDQFLTYKLLYKAGKIAIIPNALYYYFQNPNGIMGRPFSLIRLDEIDALDEQCFFFDSINDHRLFIQTLNRRLRVAGNSLLVMDRDDRGNKPEWKRLRRKILSSQRRLLIRHGKESLSITGDWWIFNQAFPFMSKIYWFGQGIKGKIKNMFKKRQ